MSEENLSCLVISGPTASGKSGLALALASRFCGEIINADSVQMYREFDIGSAKPTAEEFNACPHHLFSVLEPLARFDAFSFAELSRDKISEVLSRSHLPVVSGGTGLYIKALLSGLSEFSQNEIEEVRRNLAEELRVKLEAGFLKADLLLGFHAELADLDPEGATKVSPNDTYRLLRDLAALKAVGKPLRVLQMGAPKKTIPRALVLCLWPNREELYRSIDERVEKMLSVGFVEEVRRLKDKFPDAPALNSIGYAQISDYLEGRIRQEDLSELIKQATRRYAKRQYTWWRHQPSKLGWIVLSDPYFVKSLENFSQVSHSLTCLVQSFMERKDAFDTDGVYLHIVNRLPVSL